jgi:hypothetical protein
VDLSCGGRDHVPQGENFFYIEKKWENFYSVGIWSLSTHDRSWVKIGVGIILWTHDRSWFKIVVGIIL